MEGENFEDLQKSAQEIMSLLLKNKENKLFLYTRNEKVVGFIPILE